MHHFHDKIVNQYSQFITTKLIMDENMIKNNIQNDR